MTRSMVLAARAPGLRVLMLLHGFGDGLDVRAVDDLDARVALPEVEARHRADALALHELGGVGGRVADDLVELGVGVLLGDLVHLGFHDLARPAPRRREIHNHELVRLLDDVVKGLLGADLRHGPASRVACPADRATTDGGRRRPAERAAREQGKCSYSACCLHCCSFATAAPSLALYLSRCNSDVSLR